MGKSSCPSFKGWHLSNVFFITRDFKCFNQITTQTIDKQQAWGHVELSSTLALVGFQSLRQNIMKLPCAVSRVWCNWRVWVIVAHSSFYPPPPIWPCCHSCRVWFSMLGLLEKIDVPVTYCMSILTQTWPLLDADSAITQSPKSSIYVITVHALCTAENIKIKAS